MRPRYGCLSVGQNIRGLVLKTSGYPDQVAVSGCHGNQVNFIISISKKLLISHIIKKTVYITVKIFATTSYL